MLVRSIALKVLLLDHLHSCDIEVLAVLDQTFLTKTFHRLDPIVKGVDCDTRFEFADDVEDKGGFCKRYIMHSRVNHQLMEVFSRHQIITILVILHEQIDAVQTLLVHQLCAHARVKLLHIIEFVDVRVEFDYLV